MHNRSDDVSGSDGERQTRAQTKAAGGKDSNANGKNSKQAGEDDGPA